ncbi:MAG: outer membrane beta-barrel protein [Gammaproteobacteria bacterium]|nr:outer membrane beta-barrel protein [Gammaproteobacteria bacterium]
MKKPLFGWAFAVFALLAAGNAQADLSTFYYGVGVTDGSVRVPGNGSKSLGTVTGTFGIQLREGLGIELEFGTASDDMNSILSAPLAQYQAALLRMGFRWNEREVYALLGHALIDIDDNLNPTDAGNAMGFGLNLFGSRTTAVNLHFLSLDDGNFNTASLGFQYYFGGYR